MKKRISIALAAAMLMTMILTSSGCTKIKATDLMENIRVKDAASNLDLSQDLGSMTDFSVRLFQAGAEEGENTLISPLCVLCALSMTANGADGQTLAQMEAVLGLPSDRLNSWLHSYMAQLPDESDYKLSLANSIWFKDDPNLTVKEEFLQVNADYYSADIYKADFNEAACRDINQWTKENTGGMIEQILDRIPEDAVMYLVNALSFDAQWESVYEDRQVRSGIFTTEDGIQRNVEMMHSTERSYLEDEKSTGFIKYYVDRKYAFVALVPNEGVSIAEYIAGLTGEHLNKMLSDPEIVNVYAAIPKFETGYGADMKEILTQMGMTDAFDWTAADFSRLGSYTGLNICISRVLHKTYLSVGEQGTKAGAAAAVEMNAEGAAEQVDYRTVKLDRPFVYMLIDCENNLPFFIGTMMDVNGD